jgi:hypothetical protein
MLPKGLRDEELSVQAERRTEKTAKSFDLRMQMLKTHLITKQPKENILLRAKQYFA